MTWETLKIFADEIVTQALKEDLNAGDPTSEIIPDTKKVKAVIIAEEECLLCGIYITEMVFKKLDSTVKTEILVKDGEYIKKGTPVLNITGKAKSILRGERTALNFLQRLSGISTLTYKFVQIVKDKNIVIADTRKTTPLLRILEKYAVKTGGGVNHRFSLGVGILLKENHLKALKPLSLKEIIAELRKKYPLNYKIEVEVENLDEFKEALESGADVIMLDNMTPQQIKEAVKLNNKKVLLEVSGGITLENIKEVAEAGVDIISIGSLTHSFCSINFTLEIEG